MSFDDVWAYLSDKFLKMEFLGHIICIFLIFIDTVKLPSIEVVSVCTPTTNEYPFPYTLIKIVLLSF